MKEFAVLTGIIGIAYLFGFIGAKKTSMGGWMDRNFTTAIKGFSILTVVWAHAGAGLGVGGIQFIAGIGVALFLICSGYGLEVSYRTHGLKGFWIKRLAKVLIPFWVVELIGMAATGTLTLKSYLLDFFLIERATSYGWFIRYIVICYLIFYVTKALNEKLNLDRGKEMFIFLLLFVAWFVLASTVLVEPTRPFTEPRQMLSFTAGIAIAKYKDEIETWLRAKSRNVLTIIGGGILCIAFMAITQLPSVKAMPYIVSNAMALLTCFPGALAVLAFGYVVKKVFENRTLAWVGALSYEIYLVHAFTLRIIENDIVRVLLFVTITVVGAIVLHSIIGLSARRRSRT